MLSLVSSPAEQPQASDSPEVQILYPYGIGIDTHSQFIQVCVLSTHPGPDGGKIIRKHEAEFPTTWAGFLQAKAFALAHLPDPPPPDLLRYCIESTGTYHMPVLKAWGGIPCVVNPLLAGPTRRKTDVLDARLLAHHSITGVWKPSFIPTEQAQVLRVLWAARREAARLATRCGNRINNIILRFGHTFGASHSMRSNEAEGILTDLIEGHVPPEPGVAPTGLPPTVRPLIRALHADMRSALKAVRAATNATLEFVRSRKWPTGGPDISGADLYDLLRTVPGVGETTALTWLAEVTDPRRFDHPKQVAAYCGCDPSLKVSAGKVTTHVRRAGNERLHQALLYAASGLLRRTGDPIGQWGRSIAGRHKKGGHRKACGAVARRIAAGLWHVHRKAEPFSYAQYYLSSKLLVPDVPLKTFLPPRLVRLLHATGIKSTPDLATAYNEGRLATIFGLGAGSIQTIKTWLHANAIRTGPDGAPAPRPAKPHQSQGKAYPLSPALQFKPKRAAKGQPNGNQTTETSRAKARSGSGTTAGSAAAAPARPTHPKHP